MPIVLTAADFETTGFKPEDGHRITEIGLVVYKFYPDTLKLEEAHRISTLVNPKRDIPQVVQDITGITPAMVKDKIVWEDIAPKISKILSMTDIFVAHNAEFDSLFVAHELLRLGLPLNEEMEVFCTMEEGRFATPLGKPPRLEELCWALNVDFNAEDAHRAIYDTEKMMEAVVKALEHGYYPALQSKAQDIEKSKMKEAA